MTSSLRDLKVYTTYPHRCSYLTGEEATTLFIDPRQSVDQTLYSNLSLLGFRRSGNHIYRPHCNHCNACIPARVPVAEFRPGHPASLPQAEWGSGGKGTLERCRR